MDIPGRLFSEGFRNDVLDIRQLHDVVLYKRELSLQFLVPGDILDGIVYGLGVERIFLYRFHAGLRFTFRPTFVRRQCEPAGNGRSGGALRRRSVLTIGVHRAAHFGRDLRCPGSPDVHAGECVGQQFLLDGSFRRLKLVFRHIVGQTIDIAKFSHIALSDCPKFLRSACGGSDVAFHLGIKPRSTGRKGVIGFVSGQLRHGVFRMIALHNDRIPGIDAADIPSVSQRNIAENVYGIKTSSPFDEIRGFPHIVIPLILIKHQGFCVISRAGDSQLCGLYSPSRSFKISSTIRSLTLSDETALSCLFCLFLS